jgi:hypothetical protein
MGLDMFLHKRTHVLHYGKNDPSPKVHVDYPGIKSERVTYVSERMGVWRKANAIHAWFVDNCQKGEDDCMEHYVDPSDLKKLLDTVNQVLADHSLASALLPTQSGFFFGNTEYGEDYFHDLTLTKKICQTALADAEGGDFYYEANW